MRVPRPGWEEVGGEVGGVVADAMGPSLSEGVTVVVEGGRILGA